MIREKNVTCIACPRGCRVHLEYSDDGRIISMEGNRCKKGESWLSQELVCPMRTLTTTVRTLFPDFPRLPVRSSGDIPLEAFPSVMKKISSLVIDKRVTCGELVEERIYEGQQGSVALIATTTLEKVEDDLTAAISQDADRANDKE